MAAFLRLIGTDRSYEGFNRLLQSIQLLDFPAVTAGIERSSVKGRVVAVTSRSQLDIPACRIFAGQIVGIISAKQTAIPLRVPRYSIIFAIDLHVIFAIATEVGICPAAAGRSHRFIGIGGNLLLHRAGLVQDQHDICGLHGLCHRRLTGGPGFDHQAQVIARSLHSFGNLHRAFRRRGDSGHLACISLICQDAAGQDRHYHDQCQYQCQ